MLTSHWEAAPNPLDTAIKPFPD